MLPLDAHIIGTPESSLAFSAWGSGILRSGGQSLTRFTGDPASIEGPQFYLYDGVRIIRLGDPLTGCEYVFAEGSIRVTVRTNELQCTLSALVDPASSSFLHTLEIINLTGQERFLQAADCLIPGFAAPDAALTAERPLDRALILSEAGGYSLCHVLTTADPLTTLTAHTDLNTFQGGGTMHAPASLADGLSDHFIPTPQTPCLGFRVQLTLGIRGRATLMFTTRLISSAAPFSVESMTPRLAELPSLLTLSRLACRSVYDTLSMNQHTAALISRCAGIMLWHGQPHQGAVSPLSASPQMLQALNLNPAQPLMTLYLYTADGLALLREALDAAAWLILSGQPCTLCVLLLGKDAESAKSLAEAACTASPIAGHIRLLLAADLDEGMRELMEASSRLLLYEGAGSLLEQLDALTMSCVDIPAKAHLTPAPLPPETLRFAHSLGGWQEQTGDYVLRLDPGEHPPRLWHALLSGSGMTSLNGSYGLGAIHWRDALLVSGESLWLHRDSSWFSPLDDRLARRFQFSPGQWRLHTLDAALDVTLTASVWPEGPWCIRTLRLKSLSTRPQALTLTIAADLGDFACLTPFASGISAERPDLTGTLCLVTPEHTPEARRMSRASFHGPDMQPIGLDRPGEDTGTVAVLSLPLRLSPGGSLSVSWLIGITDTADHLEQLLLRLRTGGVSPLLRQGRQLWAERLEKLTIATPDPALDLLLGRILPYQAALPRPDGRPDLTRTLLNAQTFSLTEPALMHEALMQAAAQQRPLDDLSTFPGERLLLPLTAASYVDATGDSGILQEQVIFPDAPPEPLHAHCMRALTSIRLGSHGLPLTGPGEFGPLPPSYQGESLLLAFVFLHALHRYAPLTSPEEQADIQAVCDRLIAAIDRCGWDGAWYLRGFAAGGQPVGSASSGSGLPDPAVQAWAMLAFPGPRAAQAIEHAWQRLWDSSAGQLRTPDTRSSAWFMEALCLLGQYDRAWLLLRALNPVLRPPTEHEPWLLPDDDGAAGLLYSIVLRHLLGLQLHGDRLPISPHVPPDWDFYALNLQYGSSTWHIHLSRDTAALTLDGDEVREDSIRLTDDGRIHQIRAGLNGE